MGFTLEDRQAVKDLLIRYAYALDVECTEDGFLALFTEDAIMEGPFSGNIQGVESLRNLIQKRSARRSKVQVRHFISNFIISGNDHEALMNAYFVSFMTDLFPPAPKPSRTAEVLFVGNYDCVARKVGNDWKLARRTVYVDNWNNGHFNDGSIGKDRKLLA